ncbi:MAG: amidase domain-containing protein [Butyricicoccaceae bacterium]
MPQLLPYDREAAVAYAHKWAYFRNPAYYDFQEIGGDCTNFASQCLYAGSGVMNFTPVYGWYYRNANDRAPAWTGVPYFYNFLTRNQGVGPFGFDADISQVEPGDFVQLATIRPDFHHTPVIVSIEGTPSLRTIYVAAHTGDVDCRPLSSYITMHKLRFIHIEGVRA